jgi:branched-chain amino acid transport system substrate-binding protein
VNIFQGVSRGHWLACGRAWATYIAVWLVGGLSTPVLSQTSTTDATPLRLGVIGPFSGASADFGTPMLNGIKLAIDEINAVGGYLGRPLELVVKDDTAEPERGRLLSEELAREKVFATIGFCNSGVAAKSVDVFQNAKLPLIIPCATGTGLTTRFPGPESFIFRVQGRDGIQAPFLIDDLVKRGLDRVAIFADTTGYGEGGLKDVVAALAAKRLKPVHVARFNLGVKDLSDELKLARAAGANVLLSYTVGPENAVVANGRKTMGWRVQQAGPWTLSFPFFIDGARDAAEGALMAQTFIAEPSNERRAAFLSSYAHKFNVRRIPVPMAAANAYDATYLLLYAMLAVRDGKLEGPALKRAMEGKMKTYYGVVATYDHPFSPEDKEAISSNMLVMGQVRNGVVTFAYPEDAKRNLFIQHKQ